VLICAIVPTYNNPLTVERVVEKLLSQGLPVVLIDDGSDTAGAEAARAAGTRPGVHLVLREKNGGKGAAVQDGFTLARELGFTHGLQVDADGQHDLNDVPLFVEAAAAHPNGVILGYPLFDESAPRGRLIGRKISIFWCNVETWGRKIVDPLCGFRIYPLDACAKLGPIGLRMDFDAEIAVRLIWDGVPAVNLPTGVRYLKPEEGGVSSFRMLRDNIRISWMHTRLVTRGIFRALGLLFRRAFGRRVKHE
jgi:glycosyltransferase involved in cell wall biosynthesis